MNPWQQGSKTVSEAVYRLTCREATVLNASHFRGFKLLGGALFAMGDAAAAKTALEEALRLHPDYPDAYCDLGERHPPCCALRRASQCGGVPGMR